jgi:hypothetical protein
MELEPVAELEEDSGTGEDSPTSSGSPSLSPQPYHEDIWAKVSICSVPGGKVNILGGHSIGHSKQNSVYIHGTYSERFPRYCYSYFTVQFTVRCHIMTRVAKCIGVDDGIFENVLY